ncbi:MAG TPA: glycosyltransferase, partial [Turneriella sp.]|nr:glycosyltransferase [Turneriella sp.]
MTTNIELSVILPTYNEAENIPILIPLLQKVLAKYNYEILVMDDNSPDGTYRIVEKMVRQDNRIRCVRRMANRGLSQAVVEGFSVAQGDAMLVMDADMQHDEAAIPQFIEHFRAGAD